MSDIQEETEGPLYYMMPLNLKLISEQLREIGLDHDQVGHVKESAEAKLPRRAMDYTETSVRISLSKKTFFQQMHSQSLGGATNLRSEVLFPLLKSKEIVKETPQGSKAKIFPRSRRVKRPATECERNAIVDHYNRLTIPAIGRSYAEIENLFRCGWAAQKTQTVIESCMDFGCKKNLLAEALIAYATVMKAHQRAPTSETTFLIARLERYFSLAVRMLQRATARWELAYQNPNLEMKRIHKRTFLLPKSIRNSNLLREDHS